MKNLYAGLQQIAETFKDSVPIEYSTLPVIRYTRINETPSLLGDDVEQNWSGLYQIDLYDRRDNEPMKEAIKELCKTNYWRILNIRETEENNTQRYIFDLKIEE